MIRGLISAIRTLTIIPIPGNTEDDFGAALPWFPLVGFFLGGLLYGLTWLWLKIPWLHWPQGAALLLVLLQIIITRGLHLDGLADWADSWGGRDRLQRLAIMKDSRIGSFGVLALIVVLLAKFIFFARLLQSGTFIWIIFVSGLSRALLVALLFGLPYARSEPGMGQPFALGASYKRLLYAHLFLLLSCIYFGPIGLGLWGIGWTAALFLRSRFKKTFGGITGDLLGASNELLETLLLMLCALPGPVLQNYLGWRMFF
jgi:adenosylcobinamide-GDP ribazoletransferase